MLNVRSDRLLARAVVCGGLIGGLLAMAGAGAFAGESWIGLGTPQVAAGTARGDAAAVAALASPEAGGLAAIAGDIDGDGMDDLVCGYEPGAVVVRLGNASALYPRSAEARRRFAANQPLDDALAREGFAVALARRPDFIVIGDFNGDGRPDVVAAERGRGEVLLLPGDGKGRVGAAAAVLVPGEVTALAAGEVDRRDGLADLVVGLVTSEGARLAVYKSAKGALTGDAPELIALTAPVMALATGELTGDGYGDIAFAAGSEVGVVAGGSRTDRRAIRTEALAARVGAIAVGDFAERDGRELAVRDEAGGIWIGEAGRLVLAATAPAGAGYSGLVAANVSSSALDDLLVPDGASGFVSVYTFEGGGYVPGGGFALAATGPCLAPLRTGVSPLDGIAVVPREGTDVAIVPAVLKAVHTVDNNGDNPDDVAGNGLCGGGAGGCSLRAAIEECNGTPAADGISFGLTGAAVTIIPASALPAITQPVTIDGTTAPGYLDTPLIDLNGNGGFFRGIEIQGSDVTIRGLIIRSFGGNGVTITSGASTKIEMNWIGLDPTGLAASPNSSSGVYDGAGESAIYSNVISGNTGSGILINAANSSVYANLVGLDKTGQNGLGNGSNGVFLNGPDNTVGPNNTISDNRGAAGVCIAGSAASGNLVGNNRIGTNPAGTVDLGNTRHGVLIRSASSNTVGGSAGNANLISGNGDDGVRIESQGIALTGDDNFVQDNKIGVNAAETGGLQNDDAGVQIVGGSDNLVEGNLISGNGAAGVEIQGLAAKESVGNIVKGNTIGLTGSGASALPNALGVRIGGSQGTIIGGPNVGDGNRIAGNSGSGVSVSDPNQSSAAPPGNVTIQGNTFGRGPSLESLPNGFQDIYLFAFAAVSGIGDVSIMDNLISSSATGTLGIRVELTTGGSDLQITGNTISNLGADGIIISNCGPATIANNTITGNGRVGVNLFHDYGAGNLKQLRVSQNSIYGNAGLGINIQNAAFDYAANPNDAGDADTGTNNLQNFPILTSVADAGGGTTKFDGSIDSEASTAYRIEFFANAACDASGNGEGESYLGFVDATTDGSGDAVFSATLAHVFDPTASYTATATDPQGNSSEFSPCFPAPPSPTPTSTPTPSPSSTPSYTPYPPRIGPEPADQAANVGQSVDFHANAVGLGTPSAPRLPKADGLEYQWFKNGQPISGQTASQLSLIGVGTADDASYNCQVTNPGGTTSTRSARLVVFDPAQTNSANHVGDSIPPLIEAGHTLNIGIIMRNTSMVTWSVPQTYRLAIVEDAGGLFQGINRLDFVDPQTVIPAGGGLAQFIAEIRAPMSPGAYSARVRMAEDGASALFGDEGILVFNVVPVANAAADWETYE